MRTITELNYKRSIVSSVRFGKGIEPVHPQSFQCVLDIDAKDPEYYRPVVKLSNDFAEECSVPFFEPLPRGWLPRFRIDSQVFLNVGELSVRETYEWALSIALVATGKMKVKFYRHEGKIGMLLTFANYASEEVLSLQKARRVLRLVRRKN